MQRRIAFKNIDRDENLEKFANEKLEKIERLLESERTPISINLVLEGGKVHAHNRVELHVTSAHFNLVAQHEGPDFIKEINHVIDTMVEEIRTAKERKNEEFRKQDSYKSA